MDRPTFASSLNPDERPVVAADAREPADAVLDRRPRIGVDAVADAVLEDHRRAAVPTHQIASRRPPPIVDQVPLAVRGDDRRRRPGSVAGRRPTRPALRRSLTEDGLPTRHCEASVEAASADSAGRRPVAAPATAPASPRPAIRSRRAQGRAAPCERARPAAGRHRRRRRSARTAAAASANVARPDSRHDPASDGVGQSGLVVRG